MSLVRAQPLSPVSSLDLGVSGQSGKERDEEGSEGWISGVSP